MRMACGPGQASVVTAMSHDSESERCAVLIAGGGVAGVEAALALRELAGERVRLTMIAPGVELVARPMTVREPFGYAGAERYPLQRIADDLDMELITDSLAWVDTEARAIHTESGGRLRYDALVLCLGAQIRVRYEHAITIDDRHLDELMHGLIQDIEGGYVSHLAFVVPPRMAWPMPLYELALMSAARADDMNIELGITVLTPEAAPLQIFGDGASRGVSELLHERGIDIITMAHCEIPQPGHVLVRPGRRVRALERISTRPGRMELSVDRVVSLPELYGPHVRGLPAAVNGFIPIDPHCQVRGVPGVYAAGDATDFALKHGGIASQQADTAAQAIAALAGASVTPAPFHPVVHGILLTGGRPRFLSARVTGGQGFSSRITDEPTWSSPAKIAAKYLAPYLEQISAQR
jgi:sulfide:quinone oxidoreductase